jgi:hypothetical protein
MVTEKLIIQCFFGAFDKFYYFGIDLVRLL